MNCDAALASHASSDANIVVFSMYRGRTRPMDTHGVKAMSNRIGRTMGIVVVALATLVGCASNNYQVRLRGAGIGSDGADW